MLNNLHESWQRARWATDRVQAALGGDIQDAEIATKLNDTTLWKSHSRGLSIKVIENDLNLMVEDFGGDQELNRRIRAYYRLLQDYMLRTRQSLVVHTNGHYLGLGVTI